MRIVQVKEFGGPKCWRWPKYPSQWPVPGRW